MFKIVVFLIVASSLTSGVLAQAAMELEPAQPSRPQQPIQLRIQTTRKLSLNEALQTAVDRNPVLLTARLQVEQAKAQILVVQAALQPTVSFTTSYTFVQSSQTRFSQGLRGLLLDRTSALSLADGSNLATAVQGEWQFFSFGGVQAQIEASQQNLISTQLALDIQAQDLKLQVAQAYYNLQLQESNVDIAESAVRNSQASLRDTRAQERAGTGTRFAVLQAEVQLSNAQQQLLGNQNQRQIAQRNLASLLNFEVPTDITVDRAEQTGSWDLSLEDSIFRALNGRSEFDQLVAQQKQAEAQAEANRAQLLPTLSLTSSFDLYQDLNFTAVPPASGYSVGVILRWNLYDGGAASAQAEQFRRSGQIAQVQFVDRSNVIRLGVESSFFTLQSSSEQITTARKGEALALESLRLSRLRFTSGVGTQLDVITAEDALTQARANLAQAIVNYNLSLAQLKRSLNLL
ncbi:TolC family protein [Candidatus Cyanaurora vandensis]|uniref:TolC family protein n=1 Tax=Candidatus Cyanaurora vandensis TaxID=2714958 RepID=UPI0025808F0E|nr:TolC family protein [Candidatus Cyanaurora vandensis]